MSAFAAGLVPEIRTILEKSDLSQVSAKGVRKQLVARGHDAETIKANRASIDERIEMIYSELTNDDPGSPSSAEVPLVSHPPSSLPEPLRKVKQEVKVEAKVIPGPAAQGYGESDADMAARLQREFDAEGSRGRASRSGAVKKKPVKRKSKATIDDEDGEPKKKRKGGGGGAFNKEMILSDALAGLVGEPRMSRPQTVKRLWEYIKEHGLQDSSDGRYILCDDAFKSVFNTDKLHMFTMNKILGHHLLDPEEVAGDVKPVTKEDPTVKAEQLSSAMIDDSDEE